MDAQVVLALPRRYARFPDWDGRLPAVPKAVTVLRPKEDLGPASKLVPVLESGLADTGDILICDDDAIYARDWAQGFLKARKAHPIAAIAASSFPAARLGLSPPVGPDAIIVQGFAGVLVSKDSLGIEIPFPPGACKYVDDIWLSALLAANGTPIVKVGHLRTLVDPIGRAAAPLQNAAEGGPTRSQANRACATLLRKLLRIWPPSD
ncbi:MAG: hypothetical protein AAF667_19250 [Pseudomonadota bacterium]